MHYTVIRYKLLVLVQEDWMQDPAALHNERLVISGLHERDGK